MPQDKEVYIMMVVPHLIGGMCNQFFQIASAYALARKVGGQMAINYDLDWVCMTPLGPPSRYRDNVYRNIPATSSVPQLHIKEPKFSYTEIQAPPSECILEGYYQSPKYFDEYREDIKNLFCFDSAHDCSHLVGDDTVGVHIRRADYVSLPTVHGILDVDYYKRAIDQVDGENVVICSDDPDWAYEHFGDQCQISNFESEVDDLYLLSQCKKVIMSNSSFSWWGAYLGIEKETVIAPSKWFGPDGPQDYNDVYLGGWKKL